MRIVHISDLHISTDFDNSRIVDALCKDLKSQAKRFDLILCSGDIANKGQTDEVNGKVILSRVNKIREAVGDTVPFLVCPGNHDINLLARDDIYSAIYTNINTSSDANKLIEKVDKFNNSDIFKHVTGFLEIAKKIDPDAYKDHPFFDARCFTLGEVSVGIVLLNSAWKTLGGGQRDYGALFLGERLIDMSLAVVKNCQIKIAVMHHTLEWLSPDEKTTIQRALINNFDALICGHNHDNNANVVCSNIGNLFLSNTGCIYQNREYFNGYSILNLDWEQRKWLVEAREYYSQRDSFDIAPRFASNGSAEFLIEEKHSSVISPIPSNAMNAAQERANSKLLSFAASEIAPKKVGAIFVEPPLAKVKEKEFLERETADIKDESSELITLREVLATHEDILLRGKRESGKTILLHQIIVNRFSEFHPKARIGCVVDISALKRLTVPEVLINATEFVGNELRRAELIELLNTGAAIIGFDNVNLHDLGHVKLITDFCSEHPNTRYLIASPEEFSDLLTNEKIPDFGRNVITIYIHSLRKRQTKELVQKWFSGVDFNIEDRLEWVNKILVKLNVPRTPFLVSILMWVIEQKPKANLINQAATVEVLVSGLLDKLHESKARSEYDSTVQEHFLSDLALALDEAKSERMESLQFEEFVIAYFRRKGLNVSTRKFTDELLTKGLLYESNSQITFKFDCFRAYFLARKFAVDKELWRSILKKSDLCRYQVEFDILTGLHRDREDVLQEVRTYCLNLLSSSNMDIDLECIEEFGSEDTIFSNPKVIDSIEKKLDLIENNGRERDEWVESSEQPSAVSIDHNVGRERKRISNSSIEINFIETLRIFSNVLRNSELIDDLELKRDCFDEILNLWAKVLLSYLTLVKRINWEEMQANNKDILSGVNVNNAKMFASLIIPQAVISMMCEAMSTPKLETFVAERLNDEHLLLRAFAVFLALDNLSDPNVKAAKKLIKDIGKNSMLSQTLFFKLLSLYLSEVSSRSTRILKDLLAEAFTIMKGSNRFNNSIGKDQFLLNVEAKRSENR